jgi:hypothetical protein
MNRQINNYEFCYFNDDEWGQYVDIEIYGDNINRQKLRPIIESYHEYDAVDYYNDIKKDIEQPFKKIEKKDDIEELFKKIEIEFEKKHDTGCNFEKINKDVLNFVVNLDILTFITITFVTVAGFCIP